MIFLFLALSCISCGIAAHDTALPTVFGDGEHTMCQGWLENMEWQTAQDSPSPTRGDFGEAQEHLPKPHLAQIATCTLLTVGL